jgi:hypothetical protein
LLWLFSLLALVFVISLLVIFSNPELVFGLPPGTQLLFIVPWLLLLLWLGMLIVGLSVWIEYRWTLGGRLLYTLLTLAAGAFIFWLYYWNIFLPRLSF